MGVLGSPTRASRRCRSTLLVAGFAGAACDFIFARSFCKRGEPRRGRVRNGVVVLHSRLREVQTHAHELLVVLVKVLLLRCGLLSLHGPAREPARQGRGLAA